MQRARFGEMAVWARVRRFDHIQADLGISRKVLTERLNHLVEQGVLERLPYDARPRCEYHLTAKGADLVEMLMVMARTPSPASRRGPT